MVNTASRTDTVFCLVFHIDIVVTAANAKDEQEVAVEQT